MINERFCSMNNDKTADQMKKYSLIITIMAMATGMAAASDHPVIVPDKSGKTAGTEILSPVEESETELENWMVEYKTFNKPMDLEPAISLEEWMIAPDAYNQAPETETGPVIESWMLEIGEKINPAEPGTELEQWMLDLPLNENEAEIRLEPWMIRIHG